MRLISTVGNVMIVIGATFMGKWSST